MNRHETVLQGHARICLFLAFSFGCWSCSTPIRSENARISGDTAGMNASSILNEPLATGEGPYFDAHPALGSIDGFSLRGRLVLEDEAIDFDTQRPWDTLSEDEIEDAPLDLVLVTPQKQCIELPPVRTDDDGYVDSPVNLRGRELRAGDYILGVRYQGQLVGRTAVRLLGRDSNGWIIRSDVDQTWLDTDFFSASAQFELVRSDVSARVTLPGMSLVYQALRSGVDGTADRPLVFLSGSPRFFKRVLETTMKREGVRHDGLVLKPFKNIIAQNLMSLELTDIIPELKEQIGYKLEALLRLRLEMPPTAPELLLGDDTEADVVAYTIYHRFTSGALDLEGLQAELVQHRVVPSWRDSIAQYAPQVQTHLAGHPAPVRGIYINRTAHTSSEYPVADYQVDGLVRYHSGAWPLILSLAQDGLVSPEAVPAVRKALEALGQTPAMLRSAVEAALEEGFLSAEPLQKTD